MKNVNQSILFDLSPLQMSSVHGGGEYTRAVFYRLCELFPNDMTLEVFFNPDKKIEKNIIELCEAKKIILNACKNNHDIIKLLKDKEYDVFYTALAYSYKNINIPPKTKFIYTIHGLRELEWLPDKYRLKYNKNDIKRKIRHYISLFFPSSWKKYKFDSMRNLFSLTNNQKIITVSNHSKFSISYFFPDLDISQIQVLYSPSKIIPVENQSESRTLDSFSVKAAKYILMINGNRAGKGAYRACSALYKLLQKQNTVPNEVNILVLGVSYKTPYLKLTNNSKRFIFHGYVSANDLEVLYKEAHLFLFPSLNEGFGYPPLEAMKYGTLCACSANSAITEICGDTVLYFNPYDETEMSIRVLQSFDKTIRKEKKEKMSLRYQEIIAKQECDLDKLIYEIIT